MCDVASTQIAPLPPAAVAPLPATVMGQYWLLFNVTRGTYVSATLFLKLHFLVTCPYFQRGVVSSLRRPRGGWAGHRVMLSGDYDGDERGRVAQYLLAHGIDVPDDDAHALVGRNLYDVATGRMEGTCDHDLLDVDRWYPAGFRERLGLQAHEAPTQDFFGATPLAAVSHDACQRVALRPYHAVTTAALFLLLLAESSGEGGGDVRAPFRGDWAGH